MLTHIVLMKLVDRADADKARELVAGLADAVPTVRSLRVGVDENRGPNAWDIGLVTTHDDAAGLQAYQQHPAHQAVIEWLGPRLAERAVVDYTA